MIYFEIYKGPETQKKINEFNKGKEKRNCIRLVDFYNNPRKVLKKYELYE